MSALPAHLQEAVAVAKRATDEANAELQAAQERHRARVASIEAALGRKLLELAAGDGPTPAPTSPTVVETLAARETAAEPETYDRAPNPTLAQDPWPEAPTKPVQRGGRGKPPTTTTPPTTTPPAAPVTNGAADGGLF